ncbi:PREDICTED: uncharacterized protein LOC105150405 [Acromyrmex echinatior]|uniref:uncharacterized protein LOC105150405 n=1 Tax=Acromyrmex echinatior TaxID=103372 RepID=UPI00058105F9|nr:PREDICTED: uncharacterized protein LOC105150405 [Acromyrmex echinatior]
MHMMEDKFDVKTLRAWEEETKSSETVTLNDMLEFLKNRSLILERIESRSNDRALKEKELRSKGSHGHSKLQAGKLKTTLSVADQIKEVKRRIKLCINCLRNDHYVKACKRNSYRECNGRHNTCHQQQADKDSAKSEPQDNNHQLVANVAVNHAYHKVKSASEANFVTQAAYNKLGLKKNRAFEIVTGLNEIENKIHSICEVHVKSRCSNFQASVQCLIVSKITKNLPSTNIDRDKLQIPSNLVLADSEFHNNDPIDMLLGAEYFFDLLEGFGHRQGSDKRISLFGGASRWVKGMSEKILENYDSDKTRALSIDEKRCEQHFEQTVTRTSNGRFIVKLPFRDANLPIGDNREVTLKRLMRLERTLKNNEVMRDRYVKFMREYIELDHMSVLKSQSDDCKGAVYLPHHGVLKESSTSTKLRVKDDRDFQRILWRFSPEQLVQEYRLNTVTYGQTCASYLAVRYLRQLGEEGKESYPLASHILLNDTYVDDIISGTSTIENARSLQEQLTMLLREEGFEAHKCFKIDANDTIRALELEWKPNSDRLQFTTNTIDHASTKREMLSAIGKLFDPLGLIGPILTVAKILMQSLWEIKTGWDDPLLDSVQDKWKEFRDSLNNTHELYVPRLVLSYIRPNTSEESFDLEFAEDVHRAEIEAKQLTAVCNRTSIIGFQRNNQHTHHKLFNVHKD